MYLVILFWNHQSSTGLTTFCGYQLKIINDVIFLTEIIDLTVYESVSPSKIYSSYSPETNKTNNG